ncbi:6-pyruvoyl tetrahydrobiopterin synthase [Geodia barretti]|uniref:6-pyruvoyltetrahydropterin synthase n=1 Tax=Geodia barretti TaxID=519541 RepID=A0AA35XES9_GEOBA|nr:6-pyruvoyl tetrahydrobiopterin synthase [Geodia barretti]
MYYLTRQTAFEASHYNRIPELGDAENFALFGAAANPNSHGHNYVLEVMVKGDVDADDGMVINLVTLDALLKTEVLANYDHKHLNRQHPVFAKNPHLQPTCENITMEIWQRLVPSLPEEMLHRVRLYESTSNFADYYGDGPMVYLTKAYEFSAAHRLHSHVLSDEENQDIFGKCNNPAGHGHNYVLEVTVKGDVDKRTGLVAGLNFLDEIVQKQVYARFDYKHLNVDTPEFETLNPTSENFVKVLWDVLVPNLRPVVLHRLRLRETPKNHFDYYGA